MIARFISRLRDAMRTPEPDTHAWVAQRRMAGYAARAAR